MKVNQKINRNYNKPFFSNRKRGLSGVPLFLFGLLIGAIAVGLFVMTTQQFDRMQYIALDAIGIAPTPTLFASQHAQTGIELYNAGLVEEALAEFEIATRQRPDDINYLYEYGRILIESDYYDEAVVVGEKGIEVAPNDVRGYVIKARALMWSDPGTAIPTAVSGLEIDPNYAPLHATLAVAYTNIGRYAEGLQRGIKAVELNPLDAFTHRAYSIPLIYTGRNSQAIEQLEEAVGINPNLTAPYFELAAQYRAIDFPEMAVGVYRRVLEIDSDNAKAYLRMCETYASVGEFIVASGFCETALDIDPEYSSAWRMLGQLQYNRRNYEGAIESFLQCIDFGSTEVECYYLRGLAHYFLGQCDDAWVVLQDALNYTSLEQIVNAINIGMENVTIRCPGYENQALPTAIPPTAIPPTPIGGI
jgi:tetratricopeptide (TPR) repeat protein